MNIVYFYPHLRTPGGIERILTAKANYMAEVLHYNVTIVTYRQFNTENYFQLNEKIKQVNLDIEDPSLFKKSKKEYSKREYKKFLTDYRFAVENFLLKNPQDIAISLFFGKEYNFLPLIKDKSKKILELHFNYEGTILNKEKNIFKFKSFQDFKNFFYIKQLKSIISKYDKLVVLSQNDLKNWENTFSNVTYIYNFSTLTAENKPLLNSKSVISVGRLNFEKGFDRLISAWRLVANKYPDWILNIFGDGILEKNLRLQIKNLHLDKNIEILPARKNIQEEYLKNSMYVMTSHFEGFPMVLLEASQLGLPCISFNCNYGPSEIIQDGFDGFLIEQGNISSLAEKIITLIENQNLRLLFSERSIKKMEKFSIDNIMLHWTNLFSELLQPRKS